MKSLNMAGVMKLPIVYVCDNNCYAMTVPAECAMAIKDIAIRAAGYGFPGQLPSTAMMSWPCMKPPRRPSPGPGRGEGPTLIECKTYRWMGHSINDPGSTARPKRWRPGRKNAPSNGLKEYLREKGLLDDPKSKRGLSRREGRDRGCGPLCRNKPPALPPKIRLLGCVRGLRPRTHDYGR